MTLRLPPSFAPSQPALLAAGFAILVMISGTGVWLVAQARADASHVMRTLDVKEKLSSLQAQVWRTEGDQRAFLLTGAQSYRDGFRADVEAVRKALRLSRAALAGAAGQPARAKLAADLSAAISAELANLEGAVAVREGGTMSGTFRRPVSDALAQSRSEEIRKIIAGIVRQEQLLLTAEVERSQRAGQLLLLANFGGTFLIIALAATSIVMVRRSTEGLKAAHEALEETNASLEATVERRTAELRQANEEIQHFAHVISHDLRSPLVNIMGFTSELEAGRKDIFERLASLRARLDDDAEADGPMAREFDEALSFIKNSIARMDRLIKAILKLTREGRRELRLELLDMTDLVRATAESFGYQAQKAGASITIDPLPPSVADRLAVEQIFANLIENALKYRREDVPGRIRVNGRTTATEVAYEVHDNGRGIDPRDHERIFEIFRRSGAQNQTGEGIGLTHVRTLVRRLGGSITVRSALGEGSTFTVTLPRRAATPSSETNA
jgi:signal transduction histidine kinase